MAEVVDIRTMMMGYVDLITQTLVTEQRLFQPPDFNLDPFQERLINTSAPLIRILAPAGAGKTRTLTAKAIDILNKDPSARILCLAFTKAAVTEFQERIARMDATYGSKIVVSTVNGYGWDVLKQSLPSAKLIDPSHPAEVYGVIKKVLLKHRLTTTADNLYSELSEFLDLTKGLGFSHTDSSTAADL